MKLTKPIPGPVVWALLAVTLASCANPRSVVAADKEDERYAERLIYDPKTGDWLEVAPPEPGTAEGDLEIARATLARADSKREFRKARKLLKNWVRTYHDSPHYGEALFYYADAEFQLGNFMKSYELYERVLDDYGATELADRALRNEIEVAQVYLSGRWRKIWGGIIRMPAYEEALDILERIATNRAPGTPHAEKALKLKADYYYQKGEFEDAERAYARLSREFPRSRFVRLALLRSAQSALASFPGVKFDDSALIEAEERFEQFRKRYPKAAEEENVPLLIEQIRNSRAQKEYTVGRFYERTKHPHAAAFYYRSVMKYWPDTTWASLAEGRLAKLGYDEVRDADVEETPMQPMSPLGPMMPLPGQ